MQTGASLDKKEEFKRLIDRQTLIERIARRRGELSNNHSLQKEKRRRGENEHKGEIKPSLRQLLMVRLPYGEDDADLSKAQRLFWTLVTLLIFLTKSYVAGSLWDVPPALFLLMGISQTGYMSRKQLLVQQEKEESREKKEKGRKGGKGKQ